MYCNWVTIRFTRIFNNNNQNTTTYKMNFQVEKLFFATQVWKLRESDLKCLARKSIFLLLHEVQENKSLKLKTTSEEMKVEINKYVKRTMP